MNIDEKEYLELKQRVEELEAKLAEPPCRRTLAGMVGRYPISRIDCVNEYLEIPLVVYHRQFGDVWHLFLMAARHLHHEKNEFRQEACRRGARWSRQYPVGKAPLFNDLSYEEQKLSADMVNEMIDVWDKYYKLAHPTGKFKNRYGLEFEVEVSE